MTFGECLVVSGLVLDIVGVVLLYRFGMPSRYPEEGTTIRFGGGTEDKAERVFCDNQDEKVPSIKVRKPMSRSWGGRA